MAVVNLEGTALTQRDGPYQTSPVAKLLAQGGNSGAILRQAVGAITAPAAASNASTLRFCNVPSSAYISGVFFSCVAQGAGTVDFGFYDTPAVAGSLSAGKIGTGQQLGAGVSVVGALARSSLVLATFDLYEKQVWQILGLASDPVKTYDIVGTVGTAWTNGGLCWLEVNYRI